MLGSAAMAQRAGVTRQQLDKYRADGMPFETGPRGAMRYDEAACLEWLARNKVPNGHGGKRRPGERGPTGPRETPPVVAKAESLAQAAEEQSARDFESTGAADSPEAMEKALRAKSAADLYCLHLAEKILTDRMERKEKEGKLIDAETLKLELGRAMQGLARHLHTLGRQAANRAASEFGMTAERGRRMAEIVQEQIDVACQTIDTGIFGANKGDGE